MFFKVAARYLHPPFRIRSFSVHRGDCSLPGLSAPGVLYVSGNLVSNRLDQWPKTLTRLLKSSLAVKLWTVRSRQRSPKDYRIIQKSKRDLDELWLHLKPLIESSGKGGLAKTCSSSRSLLLGRVLSLFLIACALRRSVTLGLKVEACCSSITCVNTHDVKLSLLYILGIVGDVKQIGARLHIPTNDDCRAAAHFSKRQEVESLLASLCGLVQYLKLSTLYEWQHGSRRKRDHLTAAQTLASSHRLKLLQYVTNNEVVNGKSPSQFLDTLYRTVLLPARTQPLLLSDCLRFTLEESNGLTSRQ